eukprot:scaffold47296_cov21-Tisochrysis_lutea.AAC.1
MGKSISSKVRELSISGFLAALLSKTWYLPLANHEEKMNQLTGWTHMSARMQCYGWSISPSHSMLQSLPLFASSLREVMRWCNMRKF